MGEGQSLTVLQETKPSLYHVISSVVWDSKDSTSYLNNYLVWLSDAIIKTLYKKKKRKMNLYVRKNEHNVITSSLCIRGC